MKKDSMEDRRETRKVEKEEEERNEALDILSSNLQKIIHHGTRADEIVKQLQKQSNEGTAHEFFEN